MRMLTILLLAVSTLVLASCASSSDYGDQSGSSYSGYSYTPSEPTPDWAKAPSDRTDVPAWNN